jgi:hypothetical protein
MRLSRSLYLRSGDSWKKIDYSKPAESWMEPLKKGTNTGLVEILANWYLDGEILDHLPRKTKRSHDCGQV